MERTKKVSIVIMKWLFSISMKFLFTIENPMRIFPPPPIVSILPTSVNGRSLFVISLNSFRSLKKGRRWTKWWLIELTLSVLVKGQLTRTTINSLGDVTWTNHLGIDWSLLTSFCAILVMVGHILWSIHQNRFLKT